METIEFNTEKYDLKKLLDPKFPLLEKMRDKTPGTYKHCQNVSSLCESVALELDIDPTLMKVLGMYHDIGKIAYPECFCENQNGSNIHDELDPMVSFHLISKHIADTTLILVQLDDFPKELIVPITQHHGNSILKSLSNKSNIEEDLFRYKNTSSPTSLEASILMICDCIDATTRSKEISENLDVEGIRNIISSTIERLENDDQLDEVKVGDLKKIKRAIQRDVESRFHKRIDYDKEDVKKVNIED
jgi:cyclic-di-AMP phosphodiesterase PgpH